MLTNTVGQEKEIMALQIGSHVRIVVRHEWRGFDGFVEEIHAPFPEEETEYWVRIPIGDDTHHAWFLARHLEELPE